MAFRGITRLTCCVALSSILAPLTPVLADTITTTDGKTLEGKIISHNDDHLIIDYRGNRVTLPASRIASVDHGLSPEEELNQKIKSATVSEANTTQAEQMATLATWAKEKGLHAKAKDLWRLALKSNPNHKQARRELGYHWYNEQWLSFAQMQKAKGLLRYKDKWIPSASLADAKEKDEKRALQLKINRYLNMLKSRNAKLRKQGWDKMVALASDSNHPELRGYADNLYKRYSAYWQTQRQRVALSEQGTTFGQLHAVSSIDRGLRRVPITVNGQQLFIELPQVGVAEIKR